MFEYYIFRTCKYLAGSLISQSQKTIPHLLMHTRFTHNSTETTIVINGFCLCYFWVLHVRTVGVKSLIIYQTVNKISIDTDQPIYKW